MGEVFQVGKAVIGDAAPVEIQTQDRWKLLQRLQAFIGDAGTVEPRRNEPVEMAEIAGTSRQIVTNPCDPAGRQQILQFFLETVPVRFR